MPKRTDIHSVLIIGAGPIIIGQACEFDYSGTQACKALKEEGYRVILINSNPATIMTDPEFADRTYIEPITPECVEKIIVREIEEMKRLGLPVDLLAVGRDKIRLVVAAVVDEIRLDVAQHVTCGMLAGRLRLDVEEIRRRLRNLAESGSRLVMRAVTSVIIAWPVSSALALVPETVPGRTSDRR